MKNFVDIRQTKEYADYMTKIGWQVISIENQKIYIKNLPLLPFSVIKILRSKKLIDLKKLKKYKPLFIKIQPFLLKDKKLNIKDNKKINLRTDKSPLLPTKTIWIDLTKTEKEIFKNINKKTRYSIKQAKKNKVKIKIILGNKITTKTLNKFYLLWIKNKPHNWLFKPSFKELNYLVNSFKDKCFFVLSFKKNNLISGVFILQSVNMSFYWIGITSVLGKKLSAQPLCLWQAIKQSKKRNLKIFDFEGIWDQRFPNLNKGWKGFSKFKKSFGGREVEFINPFIYLLPSWT